MDVKNLWTSAQQMLKGDFSKATFTLYFNENTVPIAINNNILYLSGDNRSKEFFEKQQKDKILQVFEELAANIKDIIVLTNDNQPLDLDASIDDEKVNPPKNSSEDIMDLATSISKTNMNPR